LKKGVRKCRRNESKKHKSNEKSNNVKKLINNLKRKSSRQPKEIKRINNVNNNKKGKIKWHSSMQNSNNGNINVSKKVDSSLFLLTESVKETKRYKK
jgi:hypothetical protein